MTGPADKPSDQSARMRALSFLRQGSLVRRAGGCRFGTARIPDAIVERLLAAGDAVREADRIEPRRR